MGSCKGFFSESVSAKLALLFPVILLLMWCIMHSCYDMKKRAEYFNSTKHLRAPNVYGAGINNYEGHKANEMSALVRALEEQNKLLKSNQNNYFNNLNKQNYERRKQLGKCNPERSIALD